MFSKPKYQTFTYYHALHDPTRWERDLSELKTNGFSHLILSRGLDLKSVLGAEDQKQRLVSFLNAADALQMQCILHVGNPKELYLIPDIRRWRMDYIRHVAETLGAHPAVYALLLEDAPTGGIQFGLDRWKMVTTELEGRLESAALTEDGYQHAVKTWQMDQYSLYIDELTALIKKVRSRVKTTISFHLDALFPVNTLAHFQDVAKALDFVIIDAGIGTANDSLRLRYLPRTLANIAATLTDRDVWMVVDAHTPSGPYAAVPREAREWTRQAREQGVQAFGWRGWDDQAWADGHTVRGRPAAERQAEYWSAILELSRSVAGQEVDRSAPSPYASLVSYDSYANRLPWLDDLTTNLILGEYGGLALRYVSDTQLMADDKFQKIRMLFTTPCPSHRTGLTERLMRFMERGGWIVAAADDFTVDEQLRPTDTRQRLFGIQEAQEMAHEDRILVTASLPYLTDGTSLGAAWSRLRLTGIDAGTRVLGRWGDGTPALILRPYGKGGSIYIGTNPYQAAKASENSDDWGRLFRSIADPEWLKGWTGA